MSKFRVSGTGCALGDFVYNGVDFNSPSFQKYKSIIPGDGGVHPGKLVFKQELERFSGKSFAKILIDVAGVRSYDSFNIGGPSIVSMINAAQLLHGMDAGVSFYGVRGKDQKGKAIESLLGNLPLDLSNYITVDGETPYTDVLSDPKYNEGRGERLFVNNLGCAVNYNQNNLNEHFWESDIIVFGGTALVPQLHNSLSQLLSRAKINGALTIVHTVYDFINEKKNPAKPWPLGNTKKSLPLIDLLIMDAEEAIRISGQSDIEGASLYFEESGASAFIITQGANAIYCYSSGKLFDKVKAELPVCNWISDEFRNNPSLRGDTTGCGDNFAGAAIASVAFQRMAGKKYLSLKEVVSWGVASGGFACYYMGGTYFEKEHGEKLALVEKMLNRYQLSIK